MSIRTRPIIWSVAALAIVAVVVLVRRGRAPRDAELAVVREGSLAVSVDEEGTTRVRDHVDVSAPAGGRWAPGARVAGDSVRQGDILGMITAAPLDARMEAQGAARVGGADATMREATAMLANTEEALRAAQRQQARVERLAEAGGVSAQDVDRARTETSERQGARDAAAFRVRAAEYELRNARAAVAGGAHAGEGQAVRAPVSGVVLRVYEEHARVVPAGTPLVQVGDPRSLEAVVPVLTTDAARIRVGQRVRLWTGGDTLDGSVSRVEPAAYTKVSALGVEEQRVPVIVKVDGAARGAVGDAFRVQARIIVSAAAGVLIVPSSALARHGDTWEVFVVSGGMARRRTVEVGERGGNLMQVRAGLVAGDTVVAFPDENITDGVRVRPVTR